LKVYIHCLWYFSKWTSRPWVENLTHRSQIPAQSIEMSKLLVSDTMIEVRISILHFVCMSFQRFTFRLSTKKNFDPPLRGRHVMLHEKFARKISVWLSVCSNNILFVFFLSILFLCWCFHLPLLTNALSLKC
jgi:hypothetical protein